LGTDSEVYEVAVADGSLTRLTDRRGPDGAPSVSPDGSRIAYLGYDDRLQGFQRTELYVMNRDGSGARSISAHLDRNLQGSGGYAGSSGPQWSPDGESVYGVYVDEGDAKLARFSLNGSHEVVSSDVGSGTAAYTGMAWAPVLPGPSFSLARNGLVAHAITTPHDPGTVVVTDGTDARELTSINDDLLPSKDLGGVEEIWWESSKDGRPVQGWIIKPPGFDPSREYPLILEIHGGPFLAYGDGFDVEKQLMAAAGYVVLYSNPRGSISYGEEFGNLIHHAYPGDDFYDLNSGVDAVIERGYIDEDNLFVTGGSGGGVLTAWMIGHTDRFNAALPFYPVINWYSFNLTSDMAGITNSYWFPGLPWDNVEHYETRSLLSVVESVKTPTLIMTGEEDWRTPMSESEQYYKALKLLGVETVLVRVPGEPHLIWTRPSHGISKITTMMGWFGRYRTDRTPAS
jgi:acylaminoacyl-peptidase